MSLWAPLLQHVRQQLICTPAAARVLQHPSTSHWATWATWCTHLGATQPGGGPQMASCTGVASSTWPRPLGALHGPLARPSMPWAQVLRPVCAKCCDCMPNKSSCSCEKLWHAQPGHLGATRPHNARACTFEFAHWPRMQLGCFCPNAVRWTAQRTATVRHTDARRAGGAAVRRP